MKATIHSQYLEELQGIEGDDSQLPRPLLKWQELA